MVAAWTGSIADEVRDVRLTHRATDDLMALVRGPLRDALNAHVAWGLSGWAALERVAPFTTTIPTAHVYVAADDFHGRLRAAIADAGLREVDDGGRIIFWRPDQRLLGLAERHDDVPIVSPPRLYADLSSFGARGQDAADNVKHEPLDPLHAHAWSATSAATQ